MAQLMFANLTWEKPHYHKNKCCGIKWDSHTISRLSDYKELPLPKSIAYKKGYLNELGWWYSTYKQASAINLLQKVFKLVFHSKLIICLWHQSKPTGSLVISFQQGKDLICSINNFETSLFGNDFFPLKLNLNYKCTVFKVLLKVSFTNLKR